MENIILGYLGKHNASPIFLNMGKYGYYLNYDDHLYSVPVCFVSMIKFSPFSLVIFLHYRWFFPIPFLHSNNGENCRFWPFLHYFSPFLEWGNGENYFLHYFSPFWAGFIQLFSPFFGHFFPIRRSEAIRFRLPNRTSNRRSPRRTEIRKSRGTRTRLL